MFWLFLGEAGEVAGGGYAQISGRGETFPGKDVIVFKFGHLLRSLALGNPRALILSKKEPILIVFCVN
jgi:hypothetical protein